MAHVPLPWRGVAVLLLAASTALGQTVEPPAEFSLDPSTPSSPDLLRQFSLESHNPLLNLMVDGEFTSYDAAPSKADAKTKPAPQTKASEKEIEVDSESCPGEIECPSAPVCLPFACCPPPQQQQCHCRKCQRKQSRGHRGGCGGGGNGYGNPYLGWPGCPICFYGCPLVPCEGGCGGCRKHQRRGCGHGCGNQGYGCAYGGGYGGWQGWNSMCGDGFLNQGCCGFCQPYVAPPPQQCQCRKCQRKRGCGNSGGGCGYGGGYGGGWGMGYGGFMDGCCGCWMPPPQQQCQGRKCQRKHGRSNNCNYGGGYGCCSGNGYGCGYPGWGGYGECNEGCGRRRHSRCHRNQGCQQPAPYACFGCPMMMPCMGGELLCGEGAFGSDF